MLEIWIIEDNEKFRRATARGLSVLAEGTRAREFGNCEEAIAAIDAGESPDVFLMDIDLPGMDGIEGISEIKQRLPDAAAMILTVFEDDEKIFRALKAGASGYCLKSDSISKIREAVEQVLQGAAPIHPRIAGRVLKLFSQLTPEQPDYGLNDREQAVLEAMTRGLVRKQIAAEMKLNLHTLDYVTRCIYRKLHVNGATAAVALAIRERLVAPPPE
ncbi:response regulator transcription factor [Rhodopirellula sp. JC740]|uniref:Response regulator transcription factor n=1 Tax=Rhodopirellula halodulae TaxID=2894198 RepID=A0ABS8NGB5_9BACT|nr:MULTISPECIES: response regulator transcription factor [unclassified Rhodopirellula]MCC9642578.1 response regulator transcription factor [Rhodopirellula sp. JC740]MCC9655951.1 response regulator transcription factor [Rhodopirellula sp. JC737]